MYERLLKQTERYLESRKEIVVPVKLVWDAMVKEGRTNNFVVPSLMADFECLLEGDKRFEFVVEKGSRRSSDPDSDDVFEHEEMEKLGFSDYQKVKLRRIPLPSLDDDKENIDALDVAVSMEDLNEELEDSSLFDSGSASATRRPSAPHLSASRAEKKKAANSVSGSSQKKSGKPAKKPSKGKSSAKKRKK
jgi:hypothetical protein